VNAARPAWWRSANDRRHCPTISFEAAVDSILDAISYLAIAGELLAVKNCEENNVG